MKTRSSFVSNSSSSSFIVVGKRPSNCNSVRLREHQARNIIRFLAEEKVKWNPDEDEVYLTEYFTDSCEFECVPEWHLLYHEDRVYAYEDGNHGAPYYHEDEEGPSHIKLGEATHPEWKVEGRLPISNAVWIRREHA
jgi:hypothetical protein